MIPVSDIVTNGYQAAAYAAVGVSLMIASFAVVDLLTPGRLRQQLWVDRNRNAAVLVGADLAAVAIIVAASIVASEGDLGAGLLYTIVYSVIGIAIMALTYLVVDLLTPGKLGELVLSPEPHPAAWVHGIARLSISLVVAASVL